MHFVCTLYTRIIQKAALVKGKIHFFRKKWRKSRMIFHYPFCVRRRVSPLRWRPEGFALALWTPSPSASKFIGCYRGFFSSTPFVLLSNDKNQETWECSAKVSKGRPQTSFVFMPFGRVRRRETGCNQKNQVTSKAKITKKAQRKPPAFAPLRKQTASKVKSGECNYSRISRRSALT